VSVLSTDVAVPEPGTRRARRLAAQATPAVTHDAPAAPVPPVEPVAPDTVRAALTRRELRLAREAELAAASARPTYDVVTAAQVVAAASAPAREVVEAAPVRQLTRRELREARLAATAEPAVVAEPSVVEQAGTGFCSDAPEPEDLAHPVAERREAAEDLELASVALTISRLAVAATAFSAGVEPARPVTPAVPVLPVLTIEEYPAAADIVEQRRAAAVASTGDAGSVPSARVRRRDLRPATASTDDAATAGMPPIPPGDGVGETFPQPEPAASSAGASARHWVPRLAVLTALGAATVVTPVVASSSAASTEAEAADPVALASESALETLVATTTTVAEASAQAADGAQAAEGGVGDTASLLASDQLAQVRDTVVASRSTERSELPQCGAPDAAVPNGALAALDSAEYVSLSMPIEEGVYRLTSQFGPRWGSIHAGTDFAAPAGTPIHAIADGKVIYAGTGKAGRSGMLVIIEHTIDGKKVESWYIHMYPDGVFVEAGDTVKVGDVIGEVGSYGNSTGPHLHLEIHTGNLEDTMASAIDPLPWLRTNGATPITSSQVCA